MTSKAGKERSGEIDPDLLAHQKAFARLARMTGKSAVPHALLFTGIGGIGKTEAARALAMMLNCETFRTDDFLAGKASPEALGRSVAACECRSCRKIRGKNHPDIFFIAATGAFIRIDAVRELRRQFGMKPFEARTRVAVISDAHSMNPEAANALLKILEEPPDRTVLVLTAPEAADLLPTVVSRCQMVRFSPIPRFQLEAVLKEKYSIPPREASVLAVLSGGSLSKVLDGGGMKWREWIHLRDWLIQAVSHLILAGSSPSGASPGMILGFAERMAGYKQQMAECLDIISLWLRDLAVRPFAPDRVLNRDYLEIIESITKNIPIKTLLAKNGAVHAARMALRSNAHPRLTMEMLALRMANHSKW